MNTLHIQINDLLIQEDIEGFISMGAPSDEYLSEATHIAQTILETDRDNLNTDTITQIITIQWANHFDLTQEDIQSRAPNIKKVSEKIFDIIK